ncbi:kinase-like domain-containing protein, partial [Armillaria borealis]
FSQPALVRLPESILGFPWSTPSNIWAIGCVAMELVGDYNLFSQVPERFDRVRHLQQITERIGKILSKFLRDCSRASRFFDQNGAYIEARVKGVPNAKHLDLSGLDEFLRACLIWDHRMRPSAAQLLLHPWLNGN